MAVRTSAARPRRGTAPGSIPSTLWACGPAPIEVADSWPPRVLTRALLEYSTPGDRVLLLPATPDAEHLLADLGRLSPTGHGQVADTDLIIATALTPDTAQPGPWTIADEASTRLRAGGLLAVLTRCHRAPDGTFRDPSGDQVEAAQNTDLLYLQHLVAVPVADDSIATTSGEPGDTTPPGTAATDPARVHIDVLVFLQPHDLTTA